MELVIPERDQQSQESNLLLKVEFRDENSKWAQLLKYLSELLLWTHFGNGITTMHILPLVKMNYGCSIKRYPRWDEIDNKSTSQT